MAHMESPTDPLEPDGKELVELSNMAKRLLENDPDIALVSTAMIAVWQTYAWLEQELNKRVAVPGCAKFIKEAMALRALDPFNPGEVLHEYADKLLPKLMQWAGSKPTLRASIPMHKAPHVIFKVPFRSFAVTFKCSGLKAGDGLIFVGDLEAQAAALKLCVEAYAQTGGKAAWFGLESDDNSNSQAVLNFPEAWWKGRGGSNEHLTEMLEPVYAHNNINLVVLSQLETLVEPVHSKSRKLWRQGYRKFVAHCQKGKGRAVIMGAASVNTLTFKRAHIMQVGYKQVAGATYLMVGTDLFPLGGNTNEKSGE